jgi:two-component system, NarL family, nitrate/nitrite response regulator NarL
MNDPIALRIVIADHQTIFRDCLKQLLKTDEGMSVIADTGNADEAVELVREHQPDVLLLEVSMLGGLDILKCAAASSVRTVALTAYTDKRSVLESLHYVNGIVLKESSPELLFESIRRVVTDQGGARQHDLTFAIDDVSLQAQRQTTNAPRVTRFGLTPRELEIIDAVAAGETNKDIAQRLNLSEKTVKHHLSNIFDKTGVFSRVELALFAINHHLAREPQQILAAAPVTLGPDGNERKH